MTNNSEAALDAATFHHLADLRWETAADAPPELRELADKATAIGARRVQVTKGAIGFHSQLSEMPAGFEVPPHSHSVDELMIILEGGCEVGGGPQLSAGDVVEVPAQTEYGFTVGDEGIRFIVVRPEASTTRLS
ncbi:MAG: cupin domain-containing protein [Acidobacteria bacterium]|nr:cupin domain-containing protein [Acidobacteriota bacterium]